MTDGCPHLEYRDGDGRFPTERAYCAAAERFVQPMRADVCNGRYGLAHGTDCEIYREHEGLSDLMDSEESTSGTATADGSDAIRGESDP